eukprot:g66308.t1
MAMFARVQQYELRKDKSPDNYVGDQTWLPNAIWDAHTVSFHNFGPHWDCRFIDSCTRPNNISATAATPRHSGYVFPCQIIHSHGADLSHGFKKAVGDMMKA